MDIPLEINIQSEWLHNLSATVCAFQWRQIIVTEQRGEAVMDNKVVNHNILQQTWVRPVHHTLQYLDARALTWRTRELRDVVCS